MEAAEYFGTEAAAEAEAANGAAPPPTEVVDVSDDAGCGGAGGTSGAGGGGGAGGAGSGGAGGHGDGLWSSAGFGAGAFAGCSKRPMSAVLAEMHARGIADRETLWAAIKQCQS